MNALVSTRADLADRVNSRFEHSWIDGELKLTQAASRQTGQREGRSQTSMWLNAAGSQPRMRALQCVPNDEEQEQEQDRTTN